MGIGSWLRKTISGAPAATGSATHDRGSGDQPPRLSFAVTFHPCLEVAGTTTFAADAVRALANRKGLGERDYFEGPAQLQRQPTNPVDPQAVAVVVDGEQVGCLPSYAARDLPLSEGASQPVPYQLHILRTGQRLLAKAHIWLGDGDPEWAHTKEHPPALTSAERINSSHQEKSSMVREALQEGGARAQQFGRGMVDGVHYLELIEPIKQLKREGRLNEALVLCYKAIQGAEADAQGGMPAPAYTEQAAIVHRKLGQRSEEIAVLQRWLALCPEEIRAGSSIGERLTKLQAK